MGAVSIGGALLYVDYKYPPIDGSDEIKVFQRQGKPNLMRLYRTGADVILAENPESKGTYIICSEYLKTIKHPAERKIEEGEIEKTIGWYDN